MRTWAERKIRAKAGLVKTWAERGWGLRAKRVRNQWKKTCIRCRTTYTDKTFVGLKKYFYASSELKQGLEGRCKSCCTKKKGSKKYRARSILNNAIQSRKIVKPKKCSRCSSQARIEGHHTDYSKPLEVMWLCPKCHRAQHRIEKSDAKQ